MSDITTESRTVPIEDPQFYIDDPWPTFRWMQDEAPMYHYAPLDTFVLTRHRDIRDATIRHQDFVNSRGIFLADVKYRGQGDAATVTDSFFPKDGEQVGTSDPPRQQELRRMIAPAFSMPAMDAVMAGVQGRSAAMVANIAPGENVDWIPLAADVPITAACHLIGLPDTDHERVQHWSDLLEQLGGDLSFEEISAAASKFASLQEYIVENVERLQKSGHRGLDLLSVLLEAELDNDKVHLGNVVMFAMTALAAGSDTTRAMLAGIVYCLADNPDQWRLLRDDRRLVPNAVEEVIRWVTPARAFLRVAAHDTEFNGTPIREGQGLYMMYMAANRDEREFPDGGRFNVTRHNASRHLAFGAGPHLCAGMRLARRQGEMMLNLLLDRFSGVEKTDVAVPVRHIIRNSWERMPVAFIA